MQVGILLSPSFLLSTWHFFIGFLSIFISLHMKSRLKPTLRFTLYKNVHGGYFAWFGDLPSSGVMCTVNWPNSTNNNADTKLINADAELNNADA